jgi:hypothetical protein
VGDGASPAYIDFDGYLWDKGGTSHTLAVGTAIDITLLTQESNDSGVLGKAEVRLADGTTFEVLTPRCA